MCQTLGGIRIRRHCCGFQWLSGCVETCGFHVTSFLHKESLFGTFDTMDIYVP